MSRCHSAYWAWVLTRTLPLHEVISSAAQVTWGTALWSVLAPFLAMKSSPLDSCYSDRACTEGLHCGNVFQTQLVDRNEMNFKLNFRNEIGFPSDKPKNPKTRLQMAWVVTEIWAPNLPWAPERPGSPNSRCFCCFSCSRLGNTTHPPWRRPTGAEGNMKSTWKLWNKHLINSKIHRDPQSQRARRAHANKSTNHQQKKGKTQIFRGTLGNEIKGDPPNTSGAAPACFQDPQYKGGKPAKYRGKMATFSPCGNHIPTYKSYKSAQVPFWTPTKGGLQSGVR